MRIQTVAVLAAALTVGAAFALVPARPLQAQPATTGAQPSQPATKPADDAANKAANDAAKKAIEEAMKKAAATGQPPAPGPSPNAVEVPDKLPVVHKEEIDGIVVEDLKIGDGYQVKPGGAVVAHYHGTLKDGGKVFDSSFNRGTPATFPLSQVIPGWQKGVPGMKIGGIRRLTIPSKLAYGERGAGADIPPNSDLVFIIQLMDALQVTDDKVGDGEEVGPQAVSVTAFTMKDADGKEVASATKDKPYIWIPGEMMGVNAGLEGMKVGGKRTIKVPKEMNLANPRLTTTYPSSVPLTVQIELLAVRNLAPAHPGK